MFYLMLCMVKPHSGLVQRALVDWPRCRRWTCLGPPVAFVGSAHVTVTVLEEIILVARACSQQIYSH